MRRSTQIRDLGPAIDRLRIKHLVALFSSFQPLDSLVMHLLCHLLVSFLFFLGSSAVFYPLDMGLDQSKDTDHISLGVGIRNRNTPLPVALILFPPSIPFHAL